MTIQTIVAGYDGSRSAREALGAAMDLVANDGVVHVVTAHEAPAGAEMSEIMALLPGEYNMGFDELANSQGKLRDAAAALANRRINHEEHIVEDEPATAILDVADDVGADLIVLGSRGLARGTRFLRGSVSSRVASHATSSVLVIHSSDEAA